MELGNLVAHHPKLQINIIRYSKKNIRVAVGKTTIRECFLSDLVPRCHLFLLNSLGVMMEE